MKLEEFAALIETVPVADMQLLFLRFDIANLDDAIAKRQAQQKADDAKAEEEIQALFAQREALKEQSLG